MSLRVPHATNIQILIVTGEHCILYTLLTRLTFISSRYIYLSILYTHFNQILWWQFFLLSLVGVKRLHICAANILIWLSHIPLIMNIYAQTNTPLYSPLVILAAYFPRDRHTFNWISILRTRIYGVRDSVFGLRPQLFNIDGNPKLINNDWNLTLRASVFFCFIQHLIEASLVLVPIKTNAWVEWIILDWISGIVSICIWKVLRERAFLN